MKPSHCAALAITIALGTLVALTSLTAACSTRNDRELESDVRAAVEKSLPILQASARTWFEERSCTSCHHLGLGMMTVALARERGFAVDEPMFAEQLAHARGARPGAREEILQGDAGINAQIGQSYKLFALAAANAPADSGTDARALFLAGKQGPDGHWRSISHRPPHEDSEFTATALAARMIQLYSPPGRAPGIARQVERAQAWLATATPRSTEERVMQLFGLSWTGGSPSSIAAARAALLAEQRADGGWAQIATRASDAYATGQSLAALNQAAGLPVTDAAYERGLAYLLRTQLADGTWHVATRRKTEGLTYFETGFPHGEDQFISYAGSAWATTAFALAVRPGPSPVLTRTERSARQVPSTPADDGVTPLMEAVLHGELDLVRALLDGGADVNASSQRGLTALMCAPGDVVIARLLIERGANVEARTTLGFNAAILAAGWNGGTDVLKLLVDHGADIDAHAEDGTTALMRAALAGDHDAIELLLAHGADIDAVDAESTSALAGTVFQGDVATLRVLLARGAQLDAEVADGESTLLHAAAIDGFPEVLEALIEAGARIDARDEEGKTALMWAATVDWGNDRSVSTLLTRGADVAVRDAEGVTAFEFAERHGHRLAAKLLRSSAKSK